MKILENVFENRIKFEVFQDIKISWTISRIRGKLSEMTAKFFTFRSKRRWKFENCKEKFLDFFDNNLQEN